MDKNQIQLNQTKILSLMKESRIYWQARKEVINTMMKNRSTKWQPSVEEVRSLLQATTHQDKINGLINNCLQKSTRRMPIERDPSQDIDVLRIRWSDMIAREFNSIASKMLREEEYDEED